MDREPRKESARRRTGRLLAIAYAAHRIVDAILHHEQALVTALAQNPLSREANARLAAQRELQEARRGRYLTATFLVEVGIASSWCGS